MTRSTNRTVHVHHTIWFWRLKFKKKNFTHTKGSRLAGNIVNLKRSIHSDVGLNANEVQTSSPLLSKLSLSRD